MAFKNDPIGFAIHEFLLHKSDPNIIVKSDLCEDDVIPVNYLFRSFEEMPDIEKFALTLQKLSGKKHSLHNIANVLIENNFINQVQYNKIIDLK